MKLSPGEFAAAYRGTARTVSDGTTIDSNVLLAQWANETAWGTVVRAFNLANIRDTPNSFARYGSLDEFAQACIATWHNGRADYAAVMAAPTPQAQLAAIVASAWSSGHYGGSLQSFYAPLEAYELTPEEHGYVLESRQILVGQEASWLSKARDDTLAGIADLKTAIAKIPGGTVDTQAILAAIADLKAHPTFDPNDAVILGIVQRIETALRGA